MELAAVDGPWRIRNDRATVTVIEDKNGKIVAEVPHLPRTFGAERRLAKANLIAAAPDLVVSATSVLAMWGPPSEIRDGLIQRSLRDAVALAVPQPGAVVVISRSTPALREFVNAARALRSVLDGSPASDPRRSRFNDALEALRRDIPDL